MSSIHRTLLERGFTPPAALYTKPDPRGTEYGHYEASIVDKPIPWRTSGVPVNGIETVRVVKRDAEGLLLWGCTFDDQVSFAGWAREET